MSSKWDSTGIAFQPETWAALSEHLLPGAFGMAFASSRGWHRLACAIEDAGLRIHPSLFIWSFGSGFPKSTRINRDGNGHTEWEEHRYGLQALKPASEPLITFTKPLTTNPFCGIMTEITFQIEVLSCILLNAQDAESLTNHLHQHLKVGADSSAQKNVGDWESLETVIIAGDPIASNLAGLTMRDFVAGPVPTPDAMRQLVSTLGIGEMDSLSARDTVTSEQIRDILQSIVWLWSECLDDLSKVRSTRTTKMEIVLITDLKTLRSCLQQTIYDAIIHANELSGLQSLVTIVENLLRNVLIKLPLLLGTTATESVSQRLADQEIDQGGKRKDGASQQNLNPVIMFQKPYSGRPVDSIVETGAGSLWIDGGRVGANVTDANYRDSSKHEVNEDGWFGAGAKRPMKTWASGRWPPNFCLIHNAPHLCATCDGTGTVRLWTVAEPPTHCPLCGWEATKGRFDPPDVPGTLVNYCGYEVKCGSCQEHFEVANVKAEIERQCDACGGTGLVGGCRRVGTKRVKSPRAGEPFQATNQVYGKWHQFYNTARYADADGCEEVTAWDCCESCAARRIGEQSGERKGFGGFKPGAERKASKGKGGYHGNFPDKLTTPGHADQGTAARFFPQFGWAAEIAERLAAADQVRYCSKSSRMERNAGLEDLPLQERQTQGRDVVHKIDRRDGKGLVSVNGQIRPVQNPHPTLKPISLCEWLCKLLLPPPEYAPRRILVPFAGVMSEAIAAMLAGWEEIVAIEMSEEYCTIGEARLKFWSQFDSYEEAMEAARSAQRGQRQREAEIEEGQLGLW